MLQQKDIPRLMFIGQRRMYRNNLKNHAQHLINIKAKVSFPLLDLGGIYKKLFNCKILIRYNFRLDDTT